MASKQSGRRWAGGARVPRMWLHAADDVLIPEPALSAQIDHLWHHSCAIAPERALALAVLVQAVEDVRRFQLSGLAHHRRLHDEALEWMTSPAGNWPFAFSNLCDAFALDADSVRASLQVPAVGAVRQAA